MEPSELFKLITALEEDLAKFYSKLRNVSSLNEYVKVFEMMEMQSSGHAKKIGKDAFSFKVKPLDVQPIYKLHNEIKKVLFDKVMHQKDTASSLTLMAGSEELISKLYQSIANHYKKIAGQYDMLATQLETIAQEELMHRDAILKSIDKLSEKG